MKQTGIYIHIPYCVKKCDYCDFYSVGDVSAQAEYFKALRKEILSYGERQIAVDSVFIGGGTPSVADAGEIVRLLDTVREVFRLAEDTEITMELNPKTFNKEKLLLYREAGINRISMGLQSANDDELKKLGRIHTADEFLFSYELLRNVGFDNVNTDIMYGLPDSDEAHLKNTLKFLLLLECEHISAYALTLRENHSLFQRGYRFPDDDMVYEQYRMVCDSLAPNYRHYEISNFTKQNHAPCRHNLKYWNRSPYIGFGAAAHSFFEELRWENPADISLYIQEITQGKEKQTEQIPEEEAKKERLMLSLRTDEGLCYEDMPPDFWSRYQALLKQYCIAGYLTQDERGISLTEDGFFVSNAIISSLLGETN